MEEIDMTQDGMEPDNIQSFTHDDQFMGPAGFGQNVAH